MKQIKKYDLEIVAFVCGAVVMIFELIGSRIIAPYVGTSIYVWTSLIGVILGSLSVGYYYGGRLADKRPSTKPLAIIIFISAFTVFFSTLVGDSISLSITFFPLPIEVKSLLISIILFTPTSLLLGTISPYAVRLRMKDVEKSGGISGNLYTISTLGSIVGTFLAGFYLIPHFGSFFSLILLSLILFLVAIFLAENEIISFLKKFFITIFLPFLIFGVVYPSFMYIFRDKNLIADVDTEYNRIFIKKGIDHLTKKPIISLSTDPFGIQGGIFTNNPNDLVFAYTKFFKMIEIIKPDAKNALMIGGCAYTYPRDFLRNFPKSNIDVAEIDPGMTMVAKKYFELGDDTRMNIIHEDGRIFLNENKKKYDVIFIDAFGSFSSIPFQLTTVESIRKISDSLKEDGVVFINLISSLEGDGGKFFRAEYATMRDVFPNIYVFALGIPPDEKVNQNIILVATKKDSIDFSSLNINPLLIQYSKKLWRGSITNDTPILTDDFAPVESYKRMSI